MTPAVETMSAAIEAKKNSEKSPKVTRKTSVLANAHPTAGNHMREKMRRIFSFILLFSRIAEEAQPRL